MAPLVDDELAQVIARHGITAIFCHNDWLALSAIRCLARDGLKVPEDVSVLGVDNSPTFVSICPEISSMQYPCADIAAAVLARLQGQTELPLIKDLKVVERKTVTRVDRLS